jgi:hypothetical protein
MFYPSSTYGHCMAVIRTRVQWYQTQQLVTVTLSEITFKSKPTNHVQQVCFFLAVFCSRHSLELVRKLRWVYWGGFLAKRLTRQRISWPNEVLHPRSQGLPCSFTVSAQPF